MTDYLNTLTTPISGMYGYNDISSDKLKNDWRWGLIRRYPNGTAPLYALTAMMKKQASKSDTFKWITKGMPSLRANVTSVYVDNALSSAYIRDGKAYDTLFVKLETATDRALFKAGQTVNIGVASDPSCSCGAEVLSVGTSGANGYVCIRLLEDDDNSVLSVPSTLADAAYIQYTGSAFPHGSTRPEPLSFGNVEYYNYTQIFRDPAEATINSLAEDTFDGSNAWNEKLLDAFMLHSVGIEWALLMGVRSRDISGVYSSNGQPKSTTGGLIPLLREECPDNYAFFNHETDSYYVGKTFLEAGLDWISYKLAAMQRFNDSYNSRLTYIGESALLWIQRAVQSKGDYNLVSGQAEFGIKIRKLITPFGDLDMQVHPLFSRHPALTNAMLIMEPRNLVYRYLVGPDGSRDTKLVPVDTGLNTGAGRDAKTAEYFTECGLEVHKLDTFGFLGGIGSDNHQV